MKAKRSVAALVILAALIPALWAVHAADKPSASIAPPRIAHPRDTLRGLQGVIVLVLPLEREVERLGLTQDALRTDTELQLRQYGIKLHTVEDFLAAPGMPSLEVAVNVLGADDDKQYLLAVNMEVRLKQIASLVRDPVTWCDATTWSKSTVAIVGRTKADQIRSWVKDMVAQFINDYLAVNPKQPAPKQEDPK